MPDKILKQDATAAAELSGVTLEEYLAQTGLTLEDPDFQVDKTREAALVESQNNQAAQQTQAMENLGLSQEDILSVSLGEKRTVGVAKGEELDAYQYVLPESGKAYTGREIIEGIRSGKTKLGGYRESMTDEQVLTKYLNGFGGKAKKELVPSRAITLPETIVTGKSKESEELENIINSYQPSEDEVEAQTETILEEANSLFLPYDQKEFNTPKEYDQYIKKANPNGNFTKGPEGFINNATDEQLLKAKEAYIRDKKTKQRADNLTDALDSAQSWWGDRQTYLDQASAQLNAKQIDKQTLGLLKKDATKIELLSQNLNINKKLINSIDIKVKNKTATIEDFNKRRILVEKIQADLNVLNQTYDNSYKPLLEKYQDNALVLDIVKREYANMPVLATNAVASTSELISGTLKVPEWLATTIGETLGVEDDIIATAAQKYFPTSIMADAMKPVHDEMRSYTQAPKDISEVNSLTDLASWGTDLVGNMIPQITLMFATGGSSLYFVAASSAGNKYDSMREMEQEFGIDYNAWQYFSAPAIVAAAEYFTEKITFGQIKRLRQVFRNKNEILKESAKYIEEQIIKGKAIKDVLGESFGEGIATFSENAVDRVILGDKTKNIWEGVPNAMASGAFMSGVVFKAPAIGAYALRPFAGKDYSAQLGKNFAMIQKLEKELQNPDLSDSMKNSIQQDILKITANSNKLLLNTFKNIDQLTDTEKQSLIDNDFKFQQIKNQYQEIVQDENLSQDVKDFKIKELTDQAREITTQKQNILVEAETRKQTESIIQAKDEGLVEALTIQEFDSTEALGDWLVANKDKYAILKNKKDSQLREEAVTYGTILQNANGSQNILINKDISRQDNVVTTAAHEFLHALIYKTVKGNVKAQIQLGNELLNELKKLAGDGKTELSQDFKQRLAGYAKQKNNAQILNLNTQEDLINYINTQRDSKGNLDGNQFEEVLTLFSEALLTKDIVVNETVLSKLGDIIRRFLQDNFGMSIKFNTGNDVLNFVRDYAASVEKGTLARSKAFKKLGTKGAKGKLVSGTQAVAKDTKKKSSVDKTAKGLKTTKDTLNKIGEDAGGNVAKLRSGRNADIIAKELFGMVEVQVNNRFQNLSEYLREELVSDVIERLLVSGEIYNFDGRGQLYGYINDRIKFRILDAVKKNPDYLDKTSKTQLEDIQKDIAVEEDTPSVQQDRKTYTNFLAANAFPDNVINDAVNKVISIVRVLKNRIDAPISKNRTVTPIIAEIKKDAGKQLDIIIKKYLGGKKDGELRSKFLKLKKVSLENATTTWLMKAMPFAVQKQVDGKFLPYPDWVGKKIDRETTSTDLAGRTSGAEIVRRVPNAANNVSDADYLGYLFEGDEVIRGRKEAFSKMVAEELAFDLISSDFENNGPVSRALAENQERIGVEVGANLGAEFKKQAERGNVKFSKIREKGLTDQQTGTIYNELLRTNISGREFSKYRETNPFGLNKEDFNAVVLELVADNFGEFIRQRAIKDSNSGVAYEKLVNNALRLAKSTGINSKLFRSQNGDLRLTFENGAQEVVELKLNDSAQFSSFGIQNLFDANGNINEAFKFTTNITDATAIREYILENKDKLEKLAKAALQNGGEINPGNGKIYYPSYVPYGKEHTAQWKSTRESSPDYVLTLDGFNQNGIIELYQRKNINLIQIGKKGLFALSNSNITKGINPFKAEVQYVIRPTISKGQLTFRVFPLVTSMQKSNFSLENKKGAEKLVENAQTENAAQKFSQRRLSGELNDMLERTKGVPAKTRFSQVAGRLAGAKKGKFRPFLPPSAEDFEGLLYNFIGKGKQGEADLKFFYDTLILPYTRGISELEKARQELKGNYVSILKAFPGIKKQLSKPIPNSPYTYDQALRVYLWTQNGYKIPGISQKEIDKLNKEIGKNADMMALAESVKSLLKGQKYPKPGEYWNVDSLLSELNDLTENVNRKEYLSEFLKNKDKIFSESNLAKIEATYGKNFRQALENILYRMETGSNKPTSTDKFTKALNEYLNGSVGTIMFFNRRSALLQLLSTINFINYTDNNPLQAAGAFINQPQFWKDFVRIFNSPKLKERRGGLKSDVQEQEIAQAAKQGGFKAVVSKLLKIGFLPTQIADSIAISFGGATFYRNRIKSYIKKGFDPKVAEIKAWEDFSLISDKTQQSGDPMLISQQQASTGGRFILSFQNTPMQMNRIIKKAGLDLINRRGSDKENITKILYYGAVQNALFGSLQNALFALLPGFDDDDEELDNKAEQKRIEAENKKITRILNGMLDTILRGSGIYGAIASTLKNLYIEYKEETAKGIWSQDEDILLAALSVSPQVQSKGRKVVNILRTKKFEKDVIEERGFDVMIDGRFQVSPTYNIIGEAAALANVPLDRVVVEINSIAEAFDSRNTIYQRMALAMGYKTWDVNAEIEEHELIKTQAKVTRKEEGKKKAKETKKSNKELLYSLERELSVKEYIEYYNNTEKMTPSERLEYLKKNKK